MGCCFSCFKQHFARGQTFSYDLAEIGRYYRDYVELMHEHRIHPTVRFFTAEQTARQWLSQMPSGKC